MIFLLWEKDNKITLPGNDVFLKYKIKNLHSLNKSNQNINNLRNFHIIYCILHYKNYFRDFLKNLNSNLYMDHLQNLKIGVALDRLLFFRYNLIYRSWNWDQKIVDPCNQVVVNLRLTVFSIKIKTFQIITNSAHYRFPSLFEGLCSWKILNREYQNCNFKLYIG